ncbi:putative WRKY transcription factor 70 [Senna tora]|uniref:Putative WRKY transcription factor 70 n=1 Tax=Senna tora TaxID=362788 RepID=A0A834WH83_9FABA|nr:putative WRKY transcription factor 70 [Senna tora]
MENVQANSSDCKNAIIQELLTGRDLAKQLLQVVGNDEEELERNIETWEKDSPVLVEDGHAWRKYGQKLTRNTKYLRCSHKYEEGCEAMKQVQRIQEKPPLFRTTYYGLHTCNNNINLTDLDPSDSSNSILISFNNTRNNNNYATQHDHPFVSSSSSTTKSKTKKEDNININKELDDHITILDDDIVQEQNTMPQYEEHVAATLSSPSTFDLFSSVKLESFDQVDDVILRCFDFDEFVRFGI